MANTTIYPYGTNGQLPSSIGIINDLTTGGADKSLSAEMGKEIKRNYLNALDEITTPETISTDTISEFVEGKQWYGYGKNIGTVWRAEPTSESGSHCARIPFAAGDVLTVWGQGTGPAHVWVLLDEDNVIVDKSDKKYGGGASTPSASISESEPAVLNPDYNGALLFSSKKNVPNGVTHQYTVMSHLNTADSENNGLMPKELAGVFDDNFFTLVDDLKQEPYPGDIDVEVLYDKAYYNCYNTASIGSTWAPTPLSATDKKCTKHNVKAGDIIEIWGQGTGPGALYVITDKDNIVRARDYGGRGSAVSTVFTQESPLTITSQWSGTLYMNCVRSVAFGATIHRTYDGAKRATTEQDGLMTMEQVAVVDELNSVLQSSGYSKKLIAVIGDSFSAPGRWQSRMNEILGSSTINVAHSGGRWASTDPSTDAYNQALSLVTNYANAERKPDYIICVLGVNDVNNAVTMGEVVYSNTIGTGSGEIDYSTFTGGIQAVLKTLKDNFTNSIIKVGFTPAGMMYMPANSEVTQRVETYLQRLQFVANLYGVGYLETRACGICRIVSSEMSAYSNNGDAHPGEAGQNRIGEYMARLMLSNL